MRNVLATLAAIMYFSGFIPYVVGIVRSGKRPVRSTWFVWALLDSITFFSMLAQHAFNFQIMAAVIGCWTVFLLSLKYGKPGFDRLDAACLAGAALGIGCWAALGDPKLGITMSLAVTFIGSIPTFVSAWKDPRDENLTAWIVITVSCVLTVAAVPSWSFVDATQPIVFLAIGAIVTAVLLARQRRTAPL
jgi:hypothetical protein